MALLHFFARLRPQHKASISVLHVHHGECDDLQQMKYRDEAAALVRNWCQFYDLALAAPGIQPGVLKKQSELEFREQRRQFYRDELVKYPNPWLVLGHHNQDLLETRLLRLIRGTGAAGFQAMQTLNEPVFRPWLSVSKPELESYVLSLPKNDLELFLTDPSNAKQTYLRNWIRNKWLPALEGRSPGAVAVMSRSLGLLNDELLKKNPEAMHNLGPDFLDRVQWKKLDPDEKLRVLGHYIQKTSAFQALSPLGKVSNPVFEHRHLKELCKRLDISQNEHKFNFMGLEWRLTRRQILVVNPRK